MNKGGFILMAQMVKHLPAMQEMRVQSLDPEVPLEKGMATPSRIQIGRASCRERV